MPTSPPAPVVAPAVPAVLYGCGRATEGQLGAGAEEHAKEQARLLAAEQPPAEDGDAGGDAGGAAGVRVFTIVTDVAARLRRRSRWALRNVASCAGGAAHTIVVTHHGGVFASGANAEGQLGLGSREPHEGGFVEVGTFDELPAARARCGADHSFVILHTGEVYGAGCNADGQLGVGHRDPLEAFQLVRSLRGKHVADIACGVGHSVAITVTGEVLAAGRNDNGQLGLNHKQRQASFVTVASLSSRGVVSIACGAAHTCARTRAGAVLATGANESGQLGLGHQKMQSAFSESKGLTGRSVLGLACGLAHTVILTADDEVFATGLNSDGQLGLGTYDSQLSFSRVRDLSGKEVCEVFAGGSRSYAATLSQQLFACGRNGDGQLGIDDAAERVPDYRPVPLPEGAGPGVAGVYSGGAHTLLVTGLGDRAGGDPGHPTFSPPMTGWQKSEECHRAAFAKKVDELVHHAEVTLSLLLRYEAVKRQMEVSQFHRNAAIVRRIELLFVVEKGEREARIQDERTERYLLRCDVKTEHLEAERWWRLAVEAEEVARERFVADEEAAWQHMRAPFHAAGATVVAQERGRIDLRVAECAQREWLQRHAIVCEHFAFYWLYSALLDDLHYKLRQMLVEAARVRALPTVPPEPPAMFHFVLRTPQLHVDMAALGEESGLAIARKAAGAALRELGEAVEEARNEVDDARGDGAARDAALRKRDEALRRGGERCAAWAREVAGDESRAALSRRGELWWWGACLGRLLDDRPDGTPPPSPHPLPAVPPAPPVAAPGDAPRALAQAAEASELAIAEVERWVQEYLDAVAEQEAAVDHAKREVWDLLVLPLRAWGSAFDHLAAMVREEERLKMLRQGVTPPPVVTIAAAGSRVAVALYLIDDALRQLAAEGMEAAWRLALVDDALLAQVQVVELRRKVAKESARSAGLAALKTALQFGALTSEAYQQHCRHMEVARPPSAGKDRGLLQLREAVRDKRVAYQHQEDMKRRAVVGECEDPGIALDQALTVMLEAKRALHKEQDAVRRRQAELWRASEMYLPDVEDELRRLTSSKLLDDLSIMPSVARGIVTDRRAGEYEYERAADGSIAGYGRPTGGAALGRHRIMWARFGTRPCVLKECRLGDVFGIPLDPNARFDFIRWVSVVDELSQHPCIAPLRAVMAEDAEDATTTYYLHYDRYTMNFEKWLTQAQATKQTGAAGTSTAEKPPPSGEKDGERVLYIMRALLAALAFMHAPRAGSPDGVVHGNLKPSNIVLDSDHPLLIDIDPALLHEGGKGAGRRRRSMPEGDGTAVAPELMYDGTPVRNDMPPTPATDVYSLGRILEQLLRCDAARQVRERYAGVADVVARMTRRDAAERPTAAAAAAALDAAAVRWDAAMEDGYAGVAAARERASAAEAALAELEAIEPAKYHDLKHADPEADDDDEDDEGAREVVAAENALRHATAVREAKEAADAAAATAAALDRRVMASESRSPDYWTGPLRQSPLLLPRNVPECPIGPHPRSYDIYPGVAITPVDTVRDRQMYDALSSLLVVPPRRGRDAKKGQPPSLRLAQAWRVEHPALWARYADERAALVRQRAAGKWVPPEAARPLQLRKEFADGVAALRAPLDAAIGEQFLLKGARAETALAFVSAGPRDWYDRGNMGCGVGGLTDDPLRCDADTSQDLEPGGLPELHTALYDRVAHPGAVHYAAVCRVAVGTLLRTHDMRTQAYGPPAEPPADLFHAPTVRNPRGPYREGGRDIALRIPGTDLPYHSIALEAPKKGPKEGLALEVRSFNSDRVIPEFLIAYWRQ